VGENTLAVSVPLWLTATHHLPSLLLVSTKTTGPPANLPTPISAARSKGQSRRAAPGEVLVAEFLAPHKIKISRLASAAGLLRKHVSDIVNGRVRITAEIAFAPRSGCSTTS
jgi:hypothetical protein